MSYTTRGVVPNTPARLAAGEALPSFALGYVGPWSDEINDATCPDCPHLGRYHDPDAGCLSQDDGGEYCHCGRCPHIPDESTGAVEWRGQAADA